MKKALIVWGGWEGHEPLQCANIVSSILEEDGFSVTLADTCDAFNRSDLTSFNLLVPICTMLTIESEPLDNLDKAIRDGTGLAGFHGGMADAFRNEPGYQYICGGQWVAHPGDIIDYKVHINAKDDPVMAGIDDFDYRSEQYYMHVDPSNEVLASTTFTAEHDAWIEGVVMPVVWKRRHGAGRVFYSSLGHTSSEFNVPQMKTILRRGMLWAAK